MNLPASTSTSASNSGSQSLSSAQIAQLANNYKLTPATLMAECCDWFIAAPWVQYVAAEIASAIARGNCGLLVSAPPRHGKSKLITVATPLWTLENFPDKNVIVATYGEDLSTDFTREVKDIIKANPDKLKLRTRRDVERAQNFMTPQGGGLKAVGLRGTITGRGANVLIVDDYIKEPKEALSFQYLESLRTWYATVARTRLEPGAVVIIVATRWVTGDLHGHIERLESRKPAGRRFYKSLKIPAISGEYDTAEQKWVQGSEPDLLGRPPGTALFPQRYTADQLEDIRLEVGSRWFQAMFQQNPAADDSAICNPANLRYVSRDDFQAVIDGHKLSGKRDGRFKWRRSWDFASTKNAGDYTAGALCIWDALLDRFYILDLVRGQYSAGKAESVYLLKNEVDDKEVEFTIEQEPGSSGAFAFMHFKNLTTQRACRAIKAAAEGSKLLKAQTFIAATERHSVWIVVDDVNDIGATPWVGQFQEEFANFGGTGGHDDIMDAVCSAYNDATGRKMSSGTWGREAKARDAIEYLKNNPDAELKESTSFSSVTFGRRDRTSGRGLEQDRLRRAYLLGGGLRRR